MGSPSGDAPMLRRTALLSALALPLAGCVTYDVTDRGAYYQVRDGAYYAPATPSRGDYYVDRRPRTVVRYYDSWGPGPWAPGYGSRWAWSWRVGHGWGYWGPSWGSSIGWGWSSSPYWGSRWYGPGWGDSRPGHPWTSRPVHPIRERPLPKPRPIIVEPPGGTPGPGLPVLREGPRVDGEPRWGGGRGWQEPVIEPEMPSPPPEDTPPPGIPPGDMPPSDGPEPRFEDPRVIEPEPRFEPPTPRFEEPRYAEPEPRFEEPRFEAPEPMEMPRMDPPPADEDPIL